MLQNFKMLLQVPSFEQDRTEKVLAQIHMPPPTLSKDIDKFKFNKNYKNSDIAKCKPCELY